MKHQKAKWLFLLFVYLVNKNICNAQQWGTPQSFGGSNPTTSNKLNAVFFPDYTTGYAVGDNGTILKTNDAGLTWTVQTSGTTKNLKALYFAGTYDGWACGAGGTILRTTNGGTTWQPLTSGTTQTLNAIYFTGSVGFVAGTNGTVLKTTNNGTNWSTAGNSSTITTTQEYTTLSYSISPSSSYDQILLMGKTTIGLFTNDSPYPLGNYWVARSAPSNRMSSAVCYYGGLTQVVSVGLSSSGLVKRSNDFGNTWSNATISPTVGLPAQLNSVHFIDQSVPYGWTVGALGKIYNSINGGYTWSQQTSNTSQNLNGVYFLTTNQGYAVGDNGTILLYGNPTTTYIKENNKENNTIEVYPNPATTELNADLSFKPTSVKIYDITGKQVIGANEFPINVSEIENGIYFMEIHSENGVLTKKIIVSKQ